VSAHAFVFLTIKKHRIRLTVQRYIPARRKINEIVLTVFKTGYGPDTYKDRLWLTTQVLSRTKAVEYKNEEWTTFKDLVQGKD